MDYTLLAANLVHYWIQLTVLLGAGAALPRLFGLKQSRMLLAYYQLLLAAAVLLPALQPWQRPELQPLVFRTASAVTAPAMPASATAFDWNQIAVTALGAGCLLRLAWLAAGLWRLQQYRRRARPLTPVPQAVSLAGETTGASAHWLETDTVTSPVTFGFRRPVVLVPPAFGNLPGESQLAIATHELLHVRRHDWAASLVEAALCGALWFHPLVWWLHQRLRLTREQAVDLETVRLTQSKTAYVAALVESAQAAQPDLAPAPTFLFRRGLARRVEALFEEVPVMSRSRLAATLSSITLGLSVVVWLTAVRFPLTAAPQATGGSVRATAAEGVLFQQPVRYPMAARRAGVEGFVTLEVAIDSDGTVSDAKVVNGPEALRRAALESVLQWHFANEEKTRKLTTVTIEFKLGDAKSAPANGNIAKIDVSQSAGRARDMLVAQLAPYLDQPATAATLQEISSIVRPFGLELAVTQTSEAGAAPRVEVRAATRSEIAAPIEPGVQRLRIGGNAQSAKMKTKVAPVYPPLAKQSRIQGTVRFEAVIAKEGNVRSLQLVSGHPLLVEAAQIAVQQWVYEPTWLNGSPVEVATMIDVNFTLAP